MSYKIKNYTIKKLFHGFASVRDYVVEDCIKNGNTLCINYNGQYMFIRGEDLNKGKSLSDEIFYSKQSNSKYKSYKLIDFDWKPSPISQQLTIL